jgi:hypothetical protein
MDWLKQILSKPEPETEPVFEIGKYYEWDKKNPFTKDLIYIRDIKNGYALYSYCDDDKARSTTHSDPIERLADLYSPIKDQLPPPQPAPSTALEACRQIKASQGYKALSPLCRALVDKALGEEV